MSDEFSDHDVSDLVTPASELAKPSPQDLVDFLPRIENPLRIWFHNYELLKFMQKMRQVPLEAIDDAIVNKTYAAAVWKMREFALQGMYTEVRALEIWLKWAEGIRNKPKREQKRISKGSAAFGAREPEKEDEKTSDESEVE